MLLDCYKNGTPCTFIQIHLENAVNCRLLNNFIADVTDNQQKMLNFKITNFAICLQLFQW